MANERAAGERPVPIRPLKCPPEYFSWGRYPRTQHDSIYKVYWTDQVAGILAAPQLRDPTTTHAPVVLARVCPMAWAGATAIHV